MAIRSQLQRSVALRGVIVALFALALTSGCQSNAQQDLVARELRMQEDQLYAMEDYLSQYQELLCKYRAENAELKRKLGGAADMLPAIDSTQRSPRSRPSQEPSQPSVPPPADIPPPSDLEVPDVPSLDETTTQQPRLHFQHTHLPGEVLQAANETQDDAHFGSNLLPPPSGLWLYGEVIRRAPDGAARLVVNIQPLDEADTATPFEGNLSLMLLAPTADGAHQSLARWDFSADDVAQASRAPDARQIQFRLQLPDGLAIDEATEIWARLLPTAGGKLLAHAPIDMTQPSRFTSRTDLGEAQVASGSATVEERIVAAAHETTSHDYSSQPTALSDGGWTIARPGQPGAPTEASNSHWRASLEPSPTIVTASATEPSDATASKGFSPQSMPREQALWAPERPGTARDTSDISARPTWSATR